MAQLEDSIMIQAPLKSVFGYVADPGNGSSFIPGLTEQTNLTTDTPSMGQRWNWTVNLIGVELHGKGETTAFEPLKKLTVKTWGDSESIRTYLFEETGGGTKVSVIIEHTKLHGPLSGLAEVVVDGIHKLNLQQSLKKLKEILEALE